MESPNGTGHLSPNLGRGENTQTPQPPIYAQTVQRGEEPPNH